MKISIMTPEGVERAEVLGGPMKALFISDLGIEETELVTVGYSPAGVHIEWKSKDGTPVTLTVVSEKGRPDLVDLLVDSKVMTTRRLATIPRPADKEPE